MIEVDLQALIPTHVNWTRTGTTIYIQNKGSWAHKRGLYSPNTYFAIAGSQHHHICLESTKAKLAKPANLPPALGERRKRKYITTNCVTN